MEGRSFFECQWAVAQTAVPNLNKKWSGGWGCGSRPIDCMCNSYQSKKKKKKCKKKNIFWILFYLGARCKFWVFMANITVPDFRAYHLSNKTKFIVIVWLWVKISIWLKTDKWSLTSVGGLVPSKWGPRRRVGLVVLPFSIFWLKWLLKFEPMHLYLVAKF